MNSEHGFYSPIFKYYATTQIQIVGKFPYSSHFNLKILKFIQLFLFLWNILQADLPPPQKWFWLGDPGGTDSTEAEFCSAWPVSLSPRWEGVRRAGKWWGRQGGSEKVRGVAFINFDRLLTAAEYCSGMFGTLVLGSDGDRNLRLAREHNLGPAVEVIRSKDRFPNFSTFIPKVLSNNIPEPACCWA